MSRNSRLHVTAFSTRLGWITLVASDTHVLQVTCSPDRVVAVLPMIDAMLADADDDCSAWRSLIERMKAFAAGERVEFTDVPLALDHLTPFQKRIVRHCRSIPYGRTLSYGALAKKAGSPRAARAVGSTMACNRFSLLVPCHRVINADGSPGAYGSPEGAKRKRELLAMEQRGLGAGEAVTEKAKPASRSRRPAAKKPPAAKARHAAAKVQAAAKASARSQKSGKRVSPSGK